MDSKGRHAHELTDPVPIDGPLHIDQWLPRWAPDGKKVLYAQEEFAWEARKDPNILSLIRKAHRYIICDQNGKTIRQLINIPKDFRALSIDWMDDDKSVVLSGYKYKLNEPPPAWGEEPASNIYKYEIRTGEMTRLIEHPGLDFMLDWISDKVLSVAPAGKKKNTVGKTKAINRPVYRNAYVAPSLEKQRRARYVLPCYFERSKLQTPRHY